VASRLVDSLLQVGVCGTELKISKDKQAGPRDLIGRIRHEFWIGKCELEDGQHIFSFGVADIVTADDPNRLNRRSIANPTELLVILTVV